MKLSEWHQTSEKLLPQYHFNRLLLVIIAGNKKLVHDSRWPSHRARLLFSWSSAVSPHYQVC